MDMQEEKIRLLNLIEVYNLYDDEIDIKLDNIDLIITKSSNDENHNITIVSDVKIDSKEIEKYDKFNSEIVLNYTISNEDFDSMNEGDVSFYFDGGFIEPEFKGTKTIKYDANDLKIEDIGEILIEIEAFLYEKEDDDDDGIEIVIEFDQEKFEDELQKLGFAKHD